MWSRIAARRFFAGNGENMNLSSKRTLKSYVRTPRRILTERQAAEVQNENRKPIEVQYTPSDLMADQASRSAIFSSRKRSTTPVSNTLTELEPFMDDNYKKKPLKRLDKLDKTANLNFVQKMARIRTKAYRDKTHHVLLEGKRLIGDALLAGCKLQTLIYCDRKILEHLPIVEGEGEHILIDKARMATWSLLDTPPGIMAIVERPDYETVAYQEFRNDRLPLTVVIDGIREPSNIGTAIRTLGAAGCAKILLTKGTCDPWEEKVLRSGMGAHFRVPIYTDVRWSKLVNYVPENFRVFLADSNSFEVVKEAASYFDDVKDEARQIAAGEFMDEPDRFGTGVKEVEMVRHDDGTFVQIESELNQRRKSKKSSSVQQHLLPIFKYHEPSYFGSDSEENHCLLIIGGETSSLSESAYQFAHLHSGCKVHVPMCNGINSLSVGAALGVIAFEIQRQYFHRQPVRKELIESGKGSVQGLITDCNEKDENISR